MPQLTKKQRHVLASLSTHPRAAGGGQGPTARDLADTMESPRFGTERFTYDQVYASLRRLARRGFVTRVDGARAAHWIVTPEGGSALADRDA